MAAAPSGHVEFDHVTPLVCVPVRFAPVRFAPVRFAFERLAFARFAFERLAFERLAFERFALVKFTPDRFCPERFDPEKFWPVQSEPQPGAAPLTTKVRSDAESPEDTGAGAGDVVVEEPEPGEDGKQPARTTAASGSRAKARIALAPARLLRVEDVGVAVGFA